MTHDETQELLGAYVLEAVTPEEKSSVEAHMSGCSICTAEVEQLRSVYGRLGLAAIEMDPPSALRTRLMNLVELDRAQWEAEQSKQNSAVAAQPQSWYERLRAFLGATSTRIAGVGAALVVAAAVVIAVLVNRNTLTVHIYHGGPVAAVVDGYDLRNVTATVGVRSDHSTAISFSNLPALPHNLAWELWFIPAKGAPVPEGGFNSGHNYSTHLPRSANGYAMAAVTIERAPGNWPAPSKYLALAVKLQS